MATTGTTQKTHQYLRIRPANEPLAADRLTAQFTQLHEAVTDPIEFCLVAEPDADEIAYYVGAPPDTLPTVRRLAQRLTPDGYAITDPDTDPLPNPQNHDYAIAELQGIGERRQDWQTRLRPPQLSDAPEQHDTARVEDAPDLALGSVAEGMLDADGRVVYQVLLRPKPDWSGEAEYRVHQLEHDEDTISQRAFKTLVGPTDPEEIDDTTTTPAHQKGDTGSRPGTRIDAILAKSASHSFEVNARLLATGPDAEPTVRELASAFAAVGGDFYRVGHRLHTDDTATELADALTSATFREADSIRDTLRRRFPLGSNHDPCIVADATTVAHFCLLDGNDLSEQARRAFSTLPQERTGVPLPDEHTLAHYDDQGLPLGHPLTADSRTLDRTVSLPPALQPLHVAWFGKTGAGKSTSLINAILENHAATDGADILIDPKGDGMPTEYLRAHYADHGDLDDVYYFDCAETLPALSFFDIRPQLDAGINRASAVQNVVDHYVEVLRGVMGTERFEQAVRSPDIIRYLVKALFDPVHGSDAYTHTDLQAAVQQLRSTRQPPQVSDPELEAMLEGIIANNERSFSELMQGVANRIEKIPLDDRLARVFNHVHADGAPRFDFHRILDEDAVVLFDLGGLRSESKRVLTLVLLSNLWTALRRRERTSTGDTPLVNLYLEEAASVAATDLLGDLLAQSRSFGLSMTLAMQFPAQLQQADAGAYEELLNNVSTIVTGNVPVDEQLTTRFATADMPPEDVGNRLRALERGQWFVSLPAPFGEAEPRPFLVESLPLPPGAPSGGDPLAPSETKGFEALFTAVGERTRQHHGLTVDTDTPTATTTSPGTDATNRVDSALPFTEPMPEPVRYDDERHVLRCEACDARYEPAIDGMERAISCCHTLNEVDRDDIPVCQVPLKLSPSERAASDSTDQQLLFLQAVYAASQQRFDPELEFDLLSDSMTLLEEYLGLADDELQELIDEGLLSEDGHMPHKLYTVTAAGRDEIGERHREGVAHGDGEGDLAESSYHRMMVAYGEKFIEQEYAADSDSDVVEAVSYHPVGDGRRLDAAGLDETGEVVVTLEAERVNNDLRTGAPADFDAMAACDPAAALWMVRNREAAHDVLAALNEPADGEPRVEKTYSENSPPQRWTIDTAGFTDILSVRRIRNQLEEQS